MTETKNTLVSIGGNYKIFHPIILFQRVAEGWTWDERGGKLQVRIILSDINFFLCQTFLYSFFVKLFVATFFFVKLFFIKIFFVKLFCIRFFFVKTFVAKIFFVKLFFIKFFFVKLFFAASLMRRLSIGRNLSSWFLLFSDDLLEITF